jgi:3-oxoacyl-(acyl-carrier-protein) synthase
MSLSVAGMGWVTPLGSGLTEVWEQLLRGAKAEPSEISDAIGKKNYPVLRVPAAALQDLPPHPRLRRASAISRFAAAAGLAALRDGGVTIEESKNARVALIFAVSNGGVIYTKRFFHDIVASGASAASPLLFPETVFNAAASHLAAILGVTGASYTVVGDGVVGLLGLRMAEDLMLQGDLDYCLVVAAEEADWLLCDAYAKWRLLRSVTPGRHRSQSNHGMILSEGAGAILIGKSGPVKIDLVHPGAHYPSRREAGRVLGKVLRELSPPANSIVIGSVNGTFIDQVEAAAVAEVLPDAAVYSPKCALGESIGASGLWQTIVGGMALRTHLFPPLGSSKSVRLDQETGPPGIVVLGCGLNQQVGGLRLSA